jgi:hypothetical protein
VGFRQTCVPPAPEVLVALPDDFEPVVRAHVR